MSEVTQLLNAIDQGDAHAASQLLPLVYAELRRLAAERLSHERAGQTLQPTALVHEAYLRLVGKGDEAQWHGRGHFFAAAAEAMRRILIENARRKRSLKAGGEHQRVEQAPDQIELPEPREDLLALNEALDKLAATDKQAADLVQLRYFAGLTLAEAARSLGMSPRSAGRLWSYARAWLRREMDAA
jgi:RNA polymerase sigma factor (TIGR02999 family)